MGLEITITDKGGERVLLDQTTVISYLEGNEYKEDIACCDENHMHFLVGRLFDIKDIIAEEL